MLRDDINSALKEAMKAIEEYKPELEGVLPKDEYFRLTRDEKTRNIPNQLLKTFANIPSDFSGDLFDGQIGCLQQLLCATDARVRDPLDRRRAHLLTKPPAQCASAQPHAAR